MQNNNPFFEIRKNYAELLSTYRNDENILCGKILAKERQLQSLETKRKELSKAFPRWTELLLRPVVEKLKIALPNWICDDEIFTPIGIDSRVSVFFIKTSVQTYEDKYADGNSIYICLQPGDLNIGELLYLTRVSTSEDTSTIPGRINAYKKIAKPVKSIEELIAFLNAQVKTNGAN
jgi:hypothetical protein